MGFVQALKEGIISGIRADALMSFNDTSRACGGSACGETFVYAVVTGHLRTLDNFPTFITER